MQEQRHSKHIDQLRYKGVFDCIRKIYIQEGFKAFYGGYATNLMRTTPAAVITFTSYEYIVKALESGFHLISHS
jgi:solute carrier family 25 folate transporter 32